MRKPVKRMNHNKKGKPKPKPVSVNSKQKTVPKKCKPCKPCEKQFIYHHIHHVQNGENIGDFGWSDIKSGISSIKEKIVGHTEPSSSEPKQRYYKRERNINTPMERARRERTLTQNIPTPPPPPPPPPQQPQRPPLTSQLKKAVRFTGHAIADTARESVSEVKRTYTNVQEAQRKFNENKAIEDAEERKRRAAEWSNYEQAKAARDAWENAPSATKARHSPPPMPQTPDVSLTEDWRKAEYAAVQGAKRLVTPQGMYAVGKGAVNTAYSGMKWLDQKRQDELAFQAEQRKQRKDEWDAMPYEQKKDILETRYLERDMRHKLKQMRQQAEDYQLDKADAYLTGRRFAPKVFKVSTPGEFGIGESSTYMDEYGREVPGIPEEVNPKRSRRPRSEAQDINNIFGFSSGSGRQIPSPLTEPPRQIMGGDEGMYDQPRRRTRYASEPPQYSSQRRIEGGVSPQREANDIKRLLM